MVLFMLMINTGFGHSLIFFSTMTAAIASSAEPVSDFQEVCQGLTPIEQMEYNCSILKEKEHDYTWEDES
jgi:hypothetical protein